MRLTLLRCAVVGVLLVFVGLVEVAPIYGQDTPVVFIHGVASDPGTWEEAASRLRGRLEIAPFRARVSWWESLETQSAQMTGQFGALPGSTIAVGHSLGGLVAREWSKSHPLQGVITLGAPNRGAPIANHLNEWADFNYSLFSAVGNAFYWISNLSYDQWWWLYSAVEGSLNWAGYVANFSLYHLASELGMQFGVPFVQEVYVGSPYLDHLNFGGGEQSQTRVAIANTASEYWRGGPFRLQDPEYGGELSIVTSTAAAALDYWGLRVYSEADPSDWQAQTAAFKLWDASFWLWNFDEFWCRATSDDHPIWSGHCLPNDGFIPTWSQFFPGGTANFEVYGGPVHTRETGNFDDYIFVAMTGFMHVPPRGGSGDPDPGSPPPASNPHGPSSGGEASDRLTPDQSLYPDQSITSSDGRFYLIYQSDGNLVLYRRDGVPLWHSQTYGTDPGRAVMQLDGNLVVYDRFGNPLWSSGTFGFDGASLIVQSDGNLVIYSPSGAPVWASGTSGS